MLAGLVFRVDKTLLVFPRETPLRAKFRGSKLRGLLLTVGPFVRPRFDVVFSDRPRLPVDGTCREKSDGDRKLRFRLADDMFPRDDRLPGLLNEFRLRGVRLLFSPGDTARDRLRLLLPLLVPRDGLLNERVGELNERDGELNERDGELNERDGELKLRDEPPRLRLGLLKEREGELKERPMLPILRLGLLKLRDIPPIEREPPMDRPILPIEREPPMDRPMLPIEREPPIDRPMEREPPMDRPILLPPPPRRWAKTDDGSNNKQLVARAKTSMVAERKRSFGI